MQWGGQVNRLQVRADLRPAVAWRSRGRVWGLSWIGRDAMRPSFESYARGCGWWLHFAGWSLWYDSTPPVTVGERGVW